MWGQTAFSAFPSPTEPPKDASTHTSEFGVYIRLVGSREFWVKKRVSYICGVHIISNRADIYVHHPLIDLPSVHPAIHSSIYPYITCPSTSHLSIHAPTHPSMHLPIHQPIHVPIIHPCTIIPPSFYSRTHQSFHSLTNIPSVHPPPSLLSCYQRKDKMKPPITHGAMKLGWDILEHTDQDWYGKSQNLPSGVDKVQRQLRPSMWPGTPVCF